MNNINIEEFIVLLVEDEADHQEMIRRNLSLPNDQQLKIVDDGEDALSYLFREGDYANPEISPTPSLILLDINLIRVNGTEVLKILKCSDEAKALDLHKIPVVIVTTSSTDKDKIEAYDNYVNSYLLKPGEAEDWKKLVKEIQQYWMGFNLSTSHNV